MSASRMIRYSSPSYVTSVPEYLPYRHLVADFHFHRDLLAVIADLAGSDSNNFTYHRLFLRSVRENDATLCALFCDEQA